MFALSYNKSTKRCGLCLVVVDIECTVIAVPVFTIYERDLLFISRILLYSYWQVCVEAFCCIHLQLRIHLFGNLTETRVH